MTSTDDDLAQHGASARRWDITSPLEMESP
jgi:hypothetical protein